MGHLTWLTDPHLDFLESDALETFISRVAAEESDGLIISGDIAESHTVLPILERFDQVLKTPVYFVLGNHDYYGSDIHTVRHEVRMWSRHSRRTKWLPDLGYLSLSEQTALVGHSGWGDGGYGDFLASTVRLNDYLKIADLVGDDPAARLASLTHLGEEGADHLERYITAAFADHRHVIVVTHVPPFVEACWYQGQATLNEWTPHFSCKAVGDRLLKIADHHPEKHLYVICGHTHSGGVAEMRDNLTVVTGGAEYGQPALQVPIEYA